MFSAIVVLENYSVKYVCEGDGDGREENSTLRERRNDESVFPRVKHCDGSVTARGCFEGERAGEKELYNLFF